MTQAPRREAMAGAVEGAILAVRDDRLVGWAWAPGAPHAPLTVDLYIDDWLVATTVADRFDAELLQRGIGEGFHAFVTPLERRPGGQGPFAVQMRLHGATEEIGAPFMVATKQQLDDLLVRRRLEGRIEGVRDGALCGWAADLYSPASEPALAFEFDGRPLPRGAPLKRDDRVVHEGGLITAWRFRVELPAAALDGRVHSIVARVGGNVELTGSPLTFGPGAGHGYGQALAALAGAIASLEQRVAPLPHHHDSAGLIEALSARLVERVDDLLTIHRDQVEQELHAMRAALVAVAGEATGGENALRVVAAPPADHGEPDLAPAVDFALRMPRLASGVVDVVAGDQGERHAVVSDRVEIELERRVRPANVVVVEGVEAASVRALLGWRIAAGGRPLLGRYQLWADGCWRFIGALPPHSADLEHLARLSIEPDRDAIEPSWAQASLGVRRILVCNGFAAAIAGREGAPIGVAAHIAGRIVGAGWHEAEEGAGGWRRWASADSRIRADLEPGGACALTLLGQDAIAGALEKFYLKVNGETAPVALRPMRGPAGRWIGEARVSVSEVGTLWTQLGASGGGSRSALEDGRGSDTRILSVALSAMVWERPDVASRSEKKKSFWRWGG